jgi:Leucine-rich repeat (LRR) protein
LQLGRNEISRLPESIGSMHTVTTLAIFSNKLTVLPPQLSQLKNLEELNIGDNNIARIENIPVTIRRLSIYANPLDYIDPDIVSRFKEFSGKHFMDYLFVDSVQADVLKLEKDKLGYQLKIIDLSSKKIHWRDYKNMPPELIKKWELQETKEPI